MEIFGNEKEIREVGEADDAEVDYVPARCVDCRWGNTNEKEYRD